MHGKEREKKLNPVKFASRLFNRANPGVKVFEEELSQGIIEAYIHLNGKIGVLVELRCKTDFVAKAEEFKKLAHELCLQIAAMNPKKNSLMRQLWIRDGTKTIKELIDEHSAKVGENIIIKRFVRYEL